MKYLEENFGTAKVHLTSEELSEIRQTIKSIEVIGARYHSHAMKVRNEYYFCIYLFKENYKTLTNFVFTKRD